MAAGKGSRTLLLSLVADNSKFDKGLKKSQSTFSKWGNAIKAAAAGAALAVAGFAAKWLGDGVQAAIAAEKVERRFAKTLKNVTKATDAQVKAVEDYVTATQMATGVNDDELRKSLELLIRRTKDVTKAQQLQTLALDLAAGADISLEAATQVLIKAQNGQFRGLEKLGIKIDDTTKKNKDTKAALQLVADQMQGQSAEAADTVAGKMQRLQERLGEVQESAGAALLQGLQPLTDWAVSPQGAATIDEAGRDIATALGEIVTQWQTLTTGMSEELDAPALETLLRYVTQLSDLLTRIVGTLLTIVNNDAFKLIMDSGPMIVPKLLGIDPFGAPTDQPGVWKGKQGSFGTPVTNITINGATDPGATAKAVNKALNQTQYAGNYWWGGRGR